MTQLARTENSITKFFRREFSPVKILDTDIYVPKIVLDGTAVIAVVFLGFKLLNPDKPITTVTSPAPIVAPIPEGIENDGLDPRLKRTATPTSTPTKLPTATPKPPETASPQKAEFSFLNDKEVKDLKITIGKDVTITTVNYTSFEIENNDFLSKAMDVVMNEMRLATTKIVDHNGNKLNDTKEFIIVYVNNSIELAEAKEKLNEKYDVELKPYDGLTNYQTAKSLKNAYIICMSISNKSGGGLNSDRNLSPFVASTALRTAIIEAQGNKSETPASHIAGILGYPDDKFKIVMDNFLKTGAISQKTFDSIMK